MKVVITSETSCNIVKTLSSRFIYYNLYLISNTSNDTSIHLSPLILAEFSLQIKNFLFNSGGINGKYGPFALLGNRTFLIYIYSVILKGRSYISTGIGKSYACNSNDSKYKQLCLE